MNRFALRMKYLGLIMIASSALAVSFPGSELQADVSQKPSSVGVTSINVIAQNREVTVPGGILGGIAKGHLRNPSKGVEGVKSVRSSVIVGRPIPDQDEPEAADDGPQTWNERGLAFIKEYMKSRIVQCDDSYFLWDKRDGLYETKTRPYFKIGMERTFPARELSRADKLNGVTKGKPETWDATWQVRIEGPWRSYSANKWSGWRNDGMWKGDYIQFTEQEEFELGTIHHDFLKLSEPKCSDGKVDVTSLMGGSDKDKGSVVKTIVVPANKAWVDTGIFLTRGQLFNIVATGKWSIGGVNAEFFDANGTPDFSGNALTGGAKVGALYAKIADYGFAPGTNYSSTSPRNGLLRLTMNDLYEKYGDNQGALEVTITVSPNSRIRSMENFARRSSTLKGTITEAIALLKTRQDRTLLENYVVSKATERIPAVAIDDKELKSFRDPAARLRKCEGLSSAESLEITLEKAQIIEPLILTGTALEHYGFREKSDQDLTWALIDLPSPACGGGPKALFFVKIGRFWYLRG